MIVSKTPLRISYVGGGSDLPAFYREDLGAVLSASIDRYIYISLNLKFDGRIRINYSRTEEVDTSHQVEHPLVRHALSLTGIHGGIEIASMADIPSKGAGLGSSSTFTVGLLNALYTFKNQFVSKETLAQQACDIEINRCGEPIGKQDQYSAAFGGLNLIRFYPDESVSVDPVICSPSILRELEESMLIFFTGRTRSASAILAQQSKNLQSIDKRMLVRRMVQLSFDLKAELELGSLENFGSILEENWRLKSQLSAGISDSKIDAWYATGIANGAKGGKLLGAGNGGFMMFFAPPERHEAITSALGNLRKMNLHFDQNGAQIVLHQT